LGRATEAVMRVVVNICESRLQRLAVQG
jgi:hypothetical protein